MEELIPIFGVFASLIAQAIKTWLAGRRGAESEETFSRLEHVVAEESEALDASKSELARERRSLDELERAITSVETPLQDVARELETATGEANLVGQHQDEVALRHAELKQELVTLHSQIGRIERQGTKSFWMGVAWNAFFFALGVGASALVA
jgi:chromosome segregation ATPase